MKIEAAVCSKKGVRSLNEDSFVLENKVNELGADETKFSVVLENPEVVFFAVADGMGGHSSGEKASHFVAEKIVSLGKETLENGITFDDNVISQKIKNIHKELSAYAKENGTPNMGTTLTGLIVQNENCGIYNAGDSRVYRLRGEYLQQLTRDDSLRNIDENAASNIITNAIGAGLCEINVSSRFSKAIVKSGDLFLICSDGVHGHFDFDSLESFLLEHKLSDIQETVDRIVDVALESGSDDNCTAMLLRIGD